MSADRPMSAFGPDLDAALRDLGNVLEIPAAAGGRAEPMPSAATGASPSLDMAARVRVRIEAEQPRRAGGPWWLPIRARARGAGTSAATPRLRRSFLLAAAALLVAAAAVTAAIGYGLPGIRILFGPPPSPSPSVPASIAPGALLGIGTPMSLDAARDLIDFPVILPPDPRIGPPDAVYLEGRRLTLVWAPADGLPGTANPGIGLLIVELHAAIDERHIEKVISAGTTVERIHVDGAPGYWVTGEPHELAYVAPDGTRVDDSIRVAGSTLVWTRDGITYRLEGELTREEAIDLAASLH